MEIGHPTGPETSSEGLADGWSLISKNINFEIKFLLRLMRDWA
jgi:hypothetical protein